MSKLKPLSQKRIIRILENNGFVLIRSGKHLTFKKIIKDGQVLTTWVPHHQEVTVFVLNYIIKQTGKPRDEFIS